jgi:predicted component of type VI protein secretion system
MPARLVPLDGGPTILLDKPILLIGRHPECDVQMESRKISRRHCCIAQVDHTLAVRDLGSTNGVRINGTQTTEGRLQPGDELTIGNLRFRIQWDDDVHERALDAEPVQHPGGIKTNLNRMPSPADDMLSLDIPIPIQEREELLRAQPAPDADHSASGRRHEPDRGGGI